MMRVWGLRYLCYGLAATVAILATNFLGNLAVFSGILLGMPFALLDERAAMTLGSGIRQLDGMLLWALLPAVLYMLAAIPAACAYRWLSALRWSGRISWRMAWFSWAMFCLLMVFCRFLFIFWTLSVGIMTVPGTGVFVESHHLFWGAVATLGFAWHVHMQGWAERRAREAETNAFA